MAVMMMMIKEMVEKGFAPNMVTYNMLIDMYGKAGKAEEAVGWFQHMRQAGLKPDLLSYSTMMSVCGKAHMYAEAENLFEQMQRAGLVADEVAFGTLVEMWGRGGHIERAAYWFIAMLRAKCLPSVATFNSLMSSCLKAGRVEEASSLLPLMVDAGIQPSLKTYTLLLSECTKAEDEAAGAEVLRLMEACGHPMHSMICCLSANWGEGQEDEWRMWEVVRRQLDAMQRGEEWEAQRACFDVTTHFLFFHQLMGRANGMWVEARRRKLYSDIMTVGRSGREGGESSLWTLDLHTMSPGTAYVATCWALQQLRRAALLPTPSSSSSSSSLSSLSSLSSPSTSSGSEDTSMDGMGLSDQELELWVFPSEVDIVTGWGKRSRIHGSSSVKTAVAGLLEGLEAPFMVDCNNPGRLVGSGPSVKVWLQQPHLADALTLRDVLPPVSHCGSQGPSNTAAAAGALYS